MNIIAVWLILFIVIILYSSLLVYLIYHAFLLEHRITILFDLLRESADKTDKINQKIEGLFAIVQKSAITKTGNAIKEAITDKNNLNTLFRRRKNRFSQKDIIYYSADRKITAKYVKPIKADTAKDPEFELPVFLNIPYFKKMLALNGWTSLTMSKYFSMHHTHLSRLLRGQNIGVSCCHRILKVIESKDHDKLFVTIDTDRKKEPSTDEEESTVMLESDSV